MLALLAVLALATVGGVIWSIGFRSDTPKAAGIGEVAQGGGRADSMLRAIPVVVAPVRQGSLDVYLFGLGTVTPLNAVMVRGRVDGQLMRVAFEEGQMVQAGDLLAQIDPRPFEVQLTLANGQLARNQALLDNARTDLERYRMLLEQDSISRQQVDTQESLVRQYEAAVLADQGGIDNAKLQLTHARIIAPISGRVGLRQVDPGNIVRASDANGIVVITQLQPIGIVFPIPEDALPRVMKRLRAGDKNIPVDAFDRAQKEKLGSGRLLAADNQIDTATGTIKLKAEFPNADGALFANQFVNVRMPVETLLNATLVPTAAIQRGAAGAFVYVVKSDQTVSVTPVKVGPVQGEIAAIDSEVSVGAMVVVDGTDRLREGAKVELVVRDKPVPAVNDATRREKRSDMEDNERLPARRNPRAKGGA
ncbi:MAG: MdtA/MuxA family multidrug efflux RND transporter periplasmic adaptor subunit [Betaproteobacteria bacterium]|nr:MdtA/MuxA family multidrug efflux RND transporter periplasmic adaptor subunit [Betaproteobacteria bacterium]